MVQLLEHRQTHTKTGLNLLPRPLTWERINYTLVQLHVSLVLGINLVVINKSVRLLSLWSVTSSFDMIKIKGKITTRDALGLDTLEHNIPDPF